MGEIKYSLCVDGKELLRIYTKVPIHINEIVEYRNDMYMVTSVRHELSVSDATICERCLHAIKLGEDNETT